RDRGQSAFASARAPEGWPHPSSRRPLESAMTLDFSRNEEFAEIREGVRRLCAGFPGEYWRKLDEKRAYPTEFVTALTEAGYLSVLVPEEYGGSGLSLSAAAAV